MQIVTATRQQSLALRNYQQEAIEAIKHNKSRRPVLVLPTGGGKTVVSSSIIVERVKKGTVLFLVHRDELIHQTVDKFQKVYDAMGELGTSVRVGIVQADQNEMDADVVVASVQSLVRRLDEWKNIHPETPTMITDECHHATATTYRKIYKELGYLDHLLETGDADVLERTGDMHLGLTATPFRRDQAKLNRVYDGVAYSVSMKRLIDEEYLVPPVSVSVPALEGVKGPNKGQDFSDRELDAVLNNELANQKIYEIWNEYAKDRLTIGFATSVDHAKDLADLFLSRGVSSAYVSGATPTKERKEIIRKFTQKEIQVLFNYGVLTEGFDEPEASALIIARPTTSMGLYQQMVGRGLRIAPWAGKKNCLVLDVVGVSENFPLVTVETLLAPEGEEADKKKYDPNPYAEKRGYEFKQAKRSKINWQELRKSRVYEVADFDHRFVRVTLIDGTTARVDAGVRDEIRPMSEKVFQGSLSDAFEYANTYAHVNLQRSAVSSAARWLDESPTAKQIEALRKRGVLEMPTTKEEAAHLLNRASPKQIELIDKFLKRAHLSARHFPDTMQEAKIMLDLIFENHWQVAGTVSALRRALPYKFDV